MATSKNYWGITITAQNALNNIAAGTGHHDKGIALAAGNICVAGSDCGGILIYGANSGEDVTVGFLGEMRFTAGQAINPGDRITPVTSGYFNVASHGDLVVGRCAEIAVASGSVGRGMFNFINPSPFEVGSAGNDAFLNFTTINNMTGSVGRAVDYTTGQFAAAATANGVIVTAAASGQTASIRYQGAIPVRAGGVVGIRRSLTIITSGFFTNGDSGDFVVGTALAASAAGNSGGTFLALVDLSNVTYAVNCNYIKY